MNGMGDIRYDPEAMLRRMGTTVLSEDLGSAARPAAGGARRGRATLWWPSTASASRSTPRCPPTRHAYAARFEIALRAMLEEGDYAGFSFHFDAIGGDGRFRQLPLLAASNLMADGYGYAAEGDTNTATLMCAAQTMIGDAHFCEMYAMDWELDSVLISHMGEGNWRVARPDRPVRLIDRRAGHRRAGQPADACVLGRARSGHHRGADPDRGRVLPAARRPRARSSIRPSCPRSRCTTSTSGPTPGLEPFMDDWLEPRRTASLRDQPRASTPVAGGGWPSCSSSTTRRSEWWTSSRGSGRLSWPPTWPCPPTVWSS